MEINYIKYYINLNKKIVKINDINIKDDNYMHKKNTIYLLLF